MPYGAEGPIYGSITAGEVNIAAAGATDRTQMTRVDATSGVTIKAHPDNAGRVYLGDATVTNASGAAAGYSLEPGEALGPIRVTNLNVIYVAADSAGDDVCYMAA
jgi:hypothetical protein